MKRSRISLSGVLPRPSLLPRFKWAAFAANFSARAPALFIRAFLFDWGSLEGSWVLTELRALPSRASFDRRAGRMSNSAPARAGALLRDAVRVLSINQLMR